MGFDAGRYYLSCQCTDLDSAAAGAAVALVPVPYAGFIRAIYACASSTITGSHVLTVTTPQGTVGTFALTGTVTAGATVYRPEASGANLRVLAGSTIQIASDQAGTGGGAGFFIIELEDASSERDLGDVVLSGIGGDMAGGQGERGGIPFHFGAGDVRLAMFTHATAITAGSASIFLADVVIGTIILQPSVAGAAREVVSSVPTSGVRSTLRRNNPGRVVSSGGATGGGRVSWCVVMSPSKEPTPLGSVHLVAHLPDLSIAGSRARFPIPVNSRLLRATLWPTRNLSVSNTVVDVAINGGASLEALTVSSAATPADPTPIRGFSRGLTAGADVIEVVSQGSAVGNNPRCVVGIELARL